MEHLIKPLQIMGGRLCHDLATPLGALSMGLEMLKDQLKLPQQQEIMELVDHSLSSAKIKLSLFRFLIGYGQSEDQPTLSDIIPWLQDYWKGSRIQFHIEELIENRGTRARFILAFILSASEFLPRGGKLTMRLTPQALQIQLNGTPIEISEEAFALFNGDSTIPSTKNVFAWYAGLLASALSLKITSERVGPESAKLWTVDG